MPRKNRQDTEMMRLWYTALESGKGCIVPCKSAGAATYYTQRLNTARRAEEAAEGAGFDYRLNGLKISKPREKGGKWFIVIESTLSGLADGPITDLDGNPIELVPPKTPVAWDIAKNTTLHSAEQRIHLITKAKSPMPKPPPERPIPASNEMPWRQIIEHTEFANLANIRLDHMNDGLPAFPIRGAILSAGQLIAQKQNCILPSDLPPAPAVPPVPSIVQDRIDTRRAKWGEKHYDAAEPDPDAPLV